MRASWAIETFSPIDEAGAVVEVGAAVDERAGADLQAPDVEEADAALQRRERAISKPQRRIEQRPERERQAAVEQIDRRQAEEIQLCGTFDLSLPTTTLRPRRAAAANADRDVLESGVLHRRGSKRLRPSKISGAFSAARMASRSGLRNDFHSVTITSASRTCSACSAIRTTSRGSSASGGRPGPPRSAGAPRRGPPDRDRRSAAPRASSSATTTRLGASRMSSVFGLKARPQIANVRPRAGAEARDDLVDEHRFCAR
jgi:hypothetical protein